MRAPQVKEDNWWEQKEVDESIGNKARDRKNEEGRRRDQGRE